MSKSHFNHFTFLHLSSGLSNGFIWCKWLLNNNIICETHADNNLFCWDIYNSEHYRNEFGCNWTIALTFFIIFFCFELHFIWFIVTKSCSDKKHIDNGYKIALTIKNNTVLLTNDEEHYIVEDEYECLSKISQY